MKYILIQNDGLIEINSFELIGASTKRDDKTKIGFFGSGLKYSIAYMMRHEIDFRVFSGTEEIFFTTVKATLKDLEFDRICINGQPTSYTTAMGPTWTKDWYVLREVYCNALDEGGCLIVKETEDINPSDEKTRIYIAITEPLEKVVERWDCYFAEDRVPLFVSPRVYTCYLGSDDGDVYTQPVTVYRKTEGVLYRKGIQVHKDKTYLYDYGCNHVNINEDRTSKSHSSLRHGIANMMAIYVDDSYVKTILRSGTHSDKSEEYRALEGSGEPEQPWAEEWVAFCNENMVVIRENSGKYAEEIARTQKEVFLVPYDFAKSLKKGLPAAQITGMGKIISGISVSEVERTPKMQYLLKDTLKILEEMGYHVENAIQVVEFDDSAMLGKGVLESKTILLSRRVFDMGRREIAVIIMLENEHIRSSVSIFSTAFHEHLLTGWLTTMENNNGIFL